jgi:hypothetical protein
VCLKDEHLLASAQAYTTTSLRGTRMVRSTQLRSRFI